MVAQLLGAADFAWMREMQQSLMPDMGTIYRFTAGSATSDGMGGYYDSEDKWNAIGTAIVRVRPLQLRGMGEVLTDAQLVSVGRWDITFPVGTEATAKDIVKSGDRVYEIVRANNDESWMTAVRLEAITHDERASYP